MVCKSLAALRESIHEVLRFATAHTWGYKFSLSGVFLGIVDLPEHFRSLPPPPPCLLCVYAFKGCFTVPHPSLNSTGVGILI